MIGNEIAQLKGGIPPQHQHSCLVGAHTNPSRSIGDRFVDNLNGYCPIGYFQMWNALCQKPYPFSVGTAAHDDVMFAALWPRSHRQLLPGVIVHHLCAQAPKWGENWDGVRRQPRLQ